MSGLRTLGRQTVVYGLSGAAPQLIGLVTLPVVARILTTADYGILELALVGMGLIGLAADLGLSSASQRSFFDYTEEQDAERRSVLATAVVATTLTTCVLAVVAVVLREPLARAVFGGSEAVVLWTAALLVATSLAGMTREIFRLHFWSGAYLVSSIVSALIGGTVSVIGVAAFDGGPEAMLAGAFVGAAGAAAFGLVRARGRYTGALSRTELRRMLAYGLPLVPTGLAVWAVTVVDRLLIEHLGSLEQVGEYAMANRLASVPLLAVTAFGIAFSPFALDLRTRDEAQERAVRAQALTVVVVVLVVLATTISVLAREAIWLLAPEFDAATDTVGLLCLGAVVFGISTVVMLEISIARRTRIFAVYAVLGAAVNIGLNVALIPPLGIAGSGIATVAAYLVLAVGYYAHAQRIGRTPYDLRLVVELVVLSTAIGALGQLPLGPIPLVVKAAGLVVLGAYLVARGLVRRHVVAAVLDTIGLGRPAGSPTGDDA